VHPDYARKLAELMEMTDRDGYEKPTEGIEAGKPVEAASKRADLGANV
jgi:4-alpha-glucanotransferase